MIARNEHDFANEIHVGIKGASIVLISLVRRLNNIISGLLEEDIAIK